MSNRSALCAQTFVPVVFYNVENLFDAKDDPEKLDEDYLPKGRLAYHEIHFQKKIANLTRVIKELSERLEAAPGLIGLAEVENAFVLDKLVGHSALKPFDYAFLHYESEDIRGIDVALLYRSEVFKILAHEKLRPRLLNDEGFNIKTRDVLFVRGILLNLEVGIYVNHWPSRRGGKKRSSSLRLQCARMVRKHMEDLSRTHPGISILVMGDFNDDPNDQSLKMIKHHLKSEKNCAFELFNPFESLHKKGYNSMVHRGQLHLFDQILLSKNFLGFCGPSDVICTRTGIFKTDLLTNQNGKYMEYPFRSFSNDSFSGGFSDHFPVYIVFESK